MGVVGKIYVLRHPVTLEIRYVGLTKLSLKHRLSLHLSEKKKITHKSHWISSLKKKGLKPLIEEIDTALTVKELEKKELYWINYYLNNGFRLTNFVTSYSVRPYKSFKDKTAKRVVQYDLKGNKVAEYNSAMEASCVLGDCGRNSTIYNICNGRRSYTYSGFVFRFEGDSFDKYKIVGTGVHKVPNYHKKYLSQKATERNKTRTSSYYKKIRKLAKLDKVIVRLSDGKKFNSIREACTKLEKSRNYFWEHCYNKVKNPKFRFEE